MRRNWYHNFMLTGYLIYTADRYINRSKADIHGDGNAFGEHASSKDEIAGHMDSRTDSSRKATTSVSAFKERVSSSSKILFYFNPILSLVHVHYYNCLGNVFILLPSVRQRVSQPFTITNLSFLLFQLKETT